MKRAKQFVPDERCLGGAHEIETEYKNMQKKIYEAKPNVRLPNQTMRQIGPRRPGTALSGSSRATQNIAKLQMADRLSINRARRRETTDMTLPNHFTNLYHLRRRIEEQYSYTERRKNLYDVEIHPVHSKLPRKSLICQDISSWLPRPTFKSDNLRPASAPPRTHEALGIASNKPHPDTAFSRQEDRHMSMQEEFRDAMLKDIIHRRIYEPEKIQELFTLYLRSNPVECRQAILQAIAELQVELDLDFDRNRL